MKGRTFNKVIEFWQTTETADGAGGYAISEQIIAKSWCNITTPKNAQRLTDLGITDVLNTILIKLRFRNDINYNAINQFIKYAGFKYVIKGVTNINLKDADIEIIATREQTDSVSVITPLNV